ncbi:MAG: sugar ABC transporter permease [Anaerolineae bacterium]|nr:sugar ABC transporter permease [Anaerolineae bacterium]
MPDIETGKLLAGLIPGLVPAAVATFRGRYILAIAALVVCVLAGLAGEYIFSLPMAINFLVTALVLRGRRGKQETSAVYKHSNARFYFLLPGVFWILTFTLFPLIYSLYLSFTNARMQNFARGFSLIGLDNYAAIPNDLRVSETIITSVYLSVGSLLLTLILGTFIAWIFNHDIPGLRIFRSILTMPLFAAPIALGFMGLILFNENSGSINYMIRGLGGQGVSWFTDPWSARTAVLLIDSWQWTPFVFIIILAAMQSIPDELYEAARLDTNSGWLLFRSITFPLIAPALGTVALLRLVETFKILDIPLSMLGGGPGSATQTYSYYIYQTGLRNFDMGYGSALAYILVIIAIVITSVYFQRMRARFE